MQFRLIPSLMKHDCRVRIRESGKKRENRCIFEEFSIHDTIRGIMRNWKNRKFVTMVRPRYSEGSQSRNVASIFEILGNFHIVESHEADSIQFLFALYLHLPVLDVLHFRDTFFPSFLRREGSTRSNSFPSYCPASRVVRHFEESESS